MEMNHGSSATNGIATTSCLLGVGADNNNTRCAFHPASSDSSDLIAQAANREAQNEVDRASPHRALALIPVEVALPHDAVGLRRLMLLLCCVLQHMSRASLPRLGVL